MGWISGAQFERDRNGLRDTCAACGREATDADPLGLADDGFRVHGSHFDDPADGYFGGQQRNSTTRDDSDEM